MTCGRPRAARRSWAAWWSSRRPWASPQPGASYPLDAVTSLGRDVNNGIVLDDPFASSEHAVLTFRGRNWYIEDLDSTNGTYVNGVPGRGPRTARVR